MYNLPCSRLDLYEFTCDWAYYIDRLLTQLSVEHKSSWLFISKVHSMQVLQQATVQQVVQSLPQQMEQVKFGLSLYDEATSCGRFLYTTFMRKS